MSKEIYTRTEKHKGRIPWNKGKKLSEETKRKLKEAHKGMKHSAETKRKMSESRKGIIFSEEHKKKISLALKGNKNTLGYKHTEKSKKKMSKNLMGNKHFLGRKHNEETRKKMSESRIKYLISGNQKNKDTDIEDKMEQELQRRNIYYEKQVPLCKVAIVDFYLPQWRIVIQCDGDWWHNKPDKKNRDINQDIILNFNGFNVFRFMGTEINKSVGKCIDKIIKFIVYRKELKNEPR